ncbi:MAG: hypothetical protein K0B11_02915 [Mariniphaga sp.]|nr:hypothetical protein [Mariniphaga sp.]
MNYLTKKIVLLLPLVIILFSCDSSKETFGEQFKFAKKDMNSGKKVNYHITFYGNWSSKGGLLPNLDKPEPNRF